MKHFYLFIALLALAASCKKHDDGGSPVQQGDVVYLESNDYTANGNKILAYRNNGDGKLVALPGSPFATGGAGVGDPEQKLGPLDSDNQLRISADGQFLLAVNSGSNTIAVFYLQNDGSLRAVPGSPFPSGGQTPVSIDVKGNTVYVVNKSQDFVHTVTSAPNYTVFTINAQGTLTPVPNATIETTAGASPAQALVSLNGKFLLGTDFLGFMLSPAQGTLRSFVIGTDGKLTPVPGTPQAIPETGGALGLTQNPRDNTLYTGFPVTGKISVYTIGDNGSLNFKTSVASGPAACWLRTAHNGNNLYALNSAENTISVFNTSNSTSPVLLNKTALKQAGPLYPNGMGGSATTSQDFSFSFSPDEKFVYVASQHTNTDFSVGNYNYLHVLAVAADGSLTENIDPLPLPVANTYRPQGVVVWHASGK